MSETARIDQAARVVLAGLVVAAVFYVNFRFVLVHFSNGGDLLDTGWFAWIMASGDPWLTSPKSVSGLSYANYHLSPYLAALSLAFHAIGTDRFMALALHQGAMFALLAASLLGLVLTNWRGARSSALFAAVTIVTLVGDVILQVASFPHFEVATLAFCTLGAALWMGHWRAPGLVAFALACLVREDGGLYAAAFLFGLLAMRPLDRRVPASLEAIAGAVACVVALVMFWIKSRYFPGYQTFTSNFSGNGWSHVTPAFLWERLGHLATDPHALTTILPALALVAISCRYGVFVLLFMPLILAQLLAVRPQLGHFTAYYAMPFVVIWVGTVVVAVYRGRTGTLHLAEPLVLLTFALLGSGPFLFAVQPPAWFPVATTALVTPVTDLPSLADEAAAAIDPAPGVCVSNGVAALIPDHFVPAQVISPESDLSACRTIYLFRTDLHYEALRPRVAGLLPGPVIRDRIERYDQRP